MKRSMIRLFSVFLSVMMIISSANFIVTAEDDIGITTNNTQINEGTDGETSEPTALIEDMSLRDKFTKHYVAEDGKRYAVVFSEQVHYEDEGGAWKEVDNTLFYDETTSKYTTNNVEGAFTASFATTVTPDGELVSVTDGEYTVSWTVSFAGTGNMQMSASSMAQIANGASGVSEVTTVDNMTNMGKATSSVRYNSVYSSADLRYSLAYGRVEEDIILNSASGFTGYMMTVNTGELTAVKNADGSVSLNNADGEEVFNIGAPWMQDANNSYSDAIAVEVIQRGSVAYIAYTPDAEWLSSAEYPVLIDPSFTTRTYQSNYMDTYVNEYDTASTTRPTFDILMVGNDMDVPYYSYIKILNFPNIPVGINVEKITFDFYANYLYTYPLNLYWVQSPWDQNTISYANQPASELLVSDIVGTVTGSRMKYSVDVTSIMDAVYDYHGYNYSEFLSGNGWQGFKIGYKNSSDDGYNTIVSSENSASAYHSTMTFEYSYTQPSGIMNNGVYRFKNAASAKYLTLHNGETENSTNVYQYEEKNDASQSFRMTYNESTGAWFIRTMCSSNGYGSALNFLYWSTVNSSGTYIPQNVTINSISSILFEQREWLVIPYQSGTYKIVSRADPNLALTSCGTGNGTSNGTLATSTGNVYVSVFTGSNNQLWDIESGGKYIIHPSTNISTLAASTNLIYVSGYTKYFNCPVTELGHTVEWSSENEEIATVDESGLVTMKNPGDTVIEAKINTADEVEYASYQVNISVAFSSGKYFLSDSEYGKYMQLESSATSYDDTGLFVEPFNFVGSNIQQWNIQHLGNKYYKITSVESGLALSVSSAQQNASGATIIQEAYVGDARQKWKIERVDESETYTISSSVVADYYIQTNENSVFQGLESTLYSYEWYIRPVMYAQSIGASYSNGEDFTEIISTAVETWRNCGYVSNSKINPAASYFTQDVLNSEVVYFSSHGNEHYLVLPNNVYLTDGTITAEFIESQGYDTPTIIDISNYNLTKAKLYVYDACVTAYTDDDVLENLCDATIAAGVDCVVGWKEELYTLDETELWQARFQSRLAAGDSILDAVSYAHSFFYGLCNESLKTCQIYGDENLVICENQNVLNSNMTSDLTIYNISYPQHNENTLQALLANLGMETATDAEVSMPQYINESQTAYVIDYRFKDETQNVIDEGYCIIVQNNRIVYIRDNTN